MILASTVYNAYPEAQALDIDPPQEGESLEHYHRRIKKDLKDCGDTLFTFILTEMIECLDNPVKCLERAQNDLQNVIIALQSNGDGVDEPS